jgi:diguanylate cyclase (GGDEF)-like protein/PAS domain S-box-containing protein
MATGSSAPWGGDDAGWASWHRVLFEHSPVGVALADEGELLMLVNPAYCALLGRSAEELVGRSPREFIHPDDLPEHDATAQRMAAVDVGDTAQRLEKRYLQPDGSTRWGWMAVTYVPGPGGRRFKMATVHDTTDRRHAEDALHTQATTDVLTGLVNRRGWRSQLPGLVAARTSLEPLTIAVLDIDHFKAYNDTHGHPAGDRVLREFADRAQTVLRRGDVLARWGGEEFALALPRCGSADASTVLAALADVMPNGLTFSAGHTTIADGESVADTWDRADTLLYNAKHRGRNQIITDP